MYPINNTYKNYLETSSSISPKNKIVVDGVEYLGDVIKTNPKISHQATSMFGCFPTKTLSFEIYDLTNTLNFENKEITVYKGIDISGPITYIPQGIFIPRADNISTNITNKTITFSNVRDKRQLFDGIYTSSLDWTSNHTGLEIVQEICTRLGITLETTTFNWASYSFAQPNFSENITDGEVISRIAEIGGEIAQISRIGGLKITGQYATGHTFERKRYEKLSYEKPFIVNTLVLGKEGIDDDIVTDNEDLKNVPYGKNIFDPNTLVSGSIGQSTGNNISASGEQHRTDYIPVNAEATYTFSCLSPMVGVNYHCYDSNKVWLGALGGSSNTITTLANTSYLRMVVNVTEGTLSSNTIINFKPQLELNDSATLYDPFVKTGVKEYRIEDNPFVDLIRSEIIDTVAPFIIGKSIIPFSLENVVDGFYLDLNDTITIEDKNGKSILATILDYQTSTRIKSNMKAEVQTVSKTNYNLAGSNKQSINEVKLQVDHINNEINSMVSRGFVTADELEEIRQSLVTQNAESITMSFNTLTEIMNAANEDTQKQFQEQSKHFRFDANGMEIGELGNEVQLRLDNDTIHFNVSSVKIMDITPNGIVINKVTADEYNISVFTFITDEDGYLTGV